MEVYLRARYMDVRIMEDRVFATMLCHHLSQVYHFDRNSLLGMLHELGKDRNAKVVSLFSI